MNWDGNRDRDRSPTPTAMCLAASPPLLISGQDLGRQICKHTELTTFSEEQMSKKMN